MCLVTTGGGQQERSKALVRQCWRADAEGIWLAAGATKVDEAPAKPGSALLLTVAGVVCPQR